MLRWGAVAIAVLIGLAPARAADTAWHFEDGVASAKNGSSVEMSCRDGFAISMWVRFEENLGDLKTRDRIYVTFTAEPRTDAGKSVTVPVDSVSHLTFESLYLILGEAGLKLAALAVRAATSLDVGASGRADAKAGDDDFFPITTLPAAGAAAAVLRVTDDCAGAGGAKSSAAPDGPVTGAWFTHAEDTGTAAVVLADGNVSLAFHCDKAAPAFDFSMPDEALPGPPGSRAPLNLLFAVDASKRWHRVDANRRSVAGRTHLYFRGPLAASWARLAMSADETIRVTLSEDGRGDATVFSAKGSAAAIRSALSACR